MSKIFVLQLSKALGASVTSIARLLSMEFLKLVAIAFVISAPLAWFASNKWLEGFAYKVDISWLMFAIAALVAMAIALVTVSFQAVRAGMINPVDSLEDGIKGASVRFKLNFGRQEGVYFSGKFFWSIYHTNTCAFG